MKPLKLVFEIGEEARIIENSLAACLVDPEPGYYLHNSSTPCMKPGKKYYQRIAGTILEITDVRQISSTVYDSDGNIAIAYPPFGRLAIFEKPTIPTVGMKIVREFIESFIESNVEWVGDRRVRFSDRLRKYMKADTTQFTYERVEPDSWPTIDTATSRILRYFAPGGIDVYKSDEVFQFCEEFIRVAMQIANHQIQSFIGSDSWNIYDIQVAHGIVTITKHGDYRAHQWERLRKHLAGENVFFKRRSLTEENGYEYVEFNTSNFF